MIEPSNMNQREVYRIVSKMIAGEYSDEIEFLKSMIHDIVKNPDFHIIGGRVWEIIPENKSYLLRFQYGNVSKIPEGYELSLKNQPVLESLAEERTTLRQESDPLLLEKGISVYSVTGVGDFIKIEKKNYFQYVLGFNAPEILQSFFETLSIIGSLATITIRDIQSKQAKRKIERDMNKASEIQRNLLPEHSIEFADFEIFGAVIPDSTVGGDYFDYLKNMDDEEDSLGILICDAASKGLSASIQALFVSGAIRMARFFSPKISSLIARLNTLIYETFPFERFVTLFYCELSRTSNRMVLYANAGHCAQIHFRANKNEFTLLPPTGGLLGIVHYQRFAVENFIMRPGDILCLFTDGILEAQDRNENFYGNERIQNHILENKHLSPQEIAYKIIEDVQKFSIGGAYNDDKTIVVIKREHTEIESSDTDTSTD